MTRWSLPCGCPGWRRRPWWGGPGGVRRGVSGHVPQSHGVAGHSGASTGAGFGAAVAILLGAGYFGISAAAFCCGLLAVAAAWLVSRLSKAHQAVALILAGMMISSLFSAGTSFVKLVADTQQQLPAITYWLMGSLSSIKAEDVRFLVLPVAVGLLPLFLLRWRMNLLTVGEEEAQSMGVRTGVLRLVVILCATLLTAASVAVSGMIGWVGLVIPTSVVCCSATTTGG